MLSRGGAVCAQPPSILTRLEISRWIPRATVVVGSDVSGRIARYYLDSEAPTFYSVNNNVLGEVRTLTGQTILAHTSLDCTKFLIPEFFRLLRDNQVHCVLYVIVPVRPREGWFCKLFYAK